MDLNQEETDVAKYGEEIEGEEFKHYGHDIGKFVNIDYETADGSLKIAKGVLKDLINGKLIILNLGNDKKRWEIHHSSIRNYCAKPVEGRA